MEKIVIEESSGRLDVWLSKRLQISRNQIQIHIKLGHILLNNRKAKPSHKLSKGEQLSIDLPPAPPTTLIPQDIALEIPYMDDEILLINKPAGMVVHPANGHPSGTLANAVVHLIQKETGGDPLRPGIVHRLDKGTSGLLVVARTPRALTYLAAQFAKHTIKRSYLALIWGTPKLDVGMIDAPLGRSVRDRKKIAIVENGKAARTHYTRLMSSNTNPSISLIQCRLETGRTHQIRVHLHSKGHPVLCDPTYGLKSPPNLGRRQLKEIDHQLLHAQTLGFEHPTKGYVEFSIPPPSDFQSVLNWLDFKQ